MTATGPAPSRAEEASRLRTVLGRGASLADAGVAVGGAVLGWYVLSTLVHKVPPPHEVLSASIDILRDSNSYDDLWSTLRHILTAFVLALVLGSVAGALAGVSPVAKSFLRPWIVVGMAVPMPVLIIVCVLIFGIGDGAGQIALTVSVAPFVATIVGDAVASHDRQLDDLSHVFRFSPWQRLRHVLAPQVTPALVAAGRTGFSLCWKLIVVIEALASSTGVGNQMQREFKLLRTDRMIAWALVFTAVMKVFDLLVFQTVERRSLRWRQVPVAARPSGS